MSKATREDIIGLFKAADVDIDVSELDPAVALTEQGLDSLDMMNVYFQLDEKYGITIEDDSIGSGEWDSLDNITAGVNKHLEAS